jgi:molybdate transport system substrate-binding protein
MFRNGIRYGVLGLAALFGAPASAAEIKVMNSGGFTAAYKDLAPGCERTTGNTVATAWGASMGTAPDAIPMRLARGEPADVLIMAAPALDQMITEGKALPGSRVDLARSSIAMAVRAGAPKPDISTVGAFTKALLEAGSIAYSASASGVYLSSEVLPRLSGGDRIMAKSRKIMSERVGSVVARGDAEIGFQQLSELIPIEASISSARCRPSCSASPCSRPASPPARRSLTPRAPSSRASPRRKPRRRS